MIAKTAEWEQQRWLKLSSASKKFSKALLSAPGPKKVTPRTQMKYAQQMRDEQLPQIPILPGAILVYQQLAVGREWKVSGTLRGAARAVEWLNEAQVQSPSGMVYRGFEEYQKRRVLDWLLVGRTAFAVRQSANAPLEYLDPTDLLFVRDRRGNAPVTNSEKVWTYRDDSLRYDEVYLAHPIPIGGDDLFLSPVAPLLPTALLAWLIREHDAASLDGRKIRDLIIVSNDNVADAVEEAILTSVSLYAGEDASKVGLPIVSINGMQGVAVEDQIFVLGLSRIPDAFDRSAFTFDYVNQISATLGLTLRHFWNSEMTTNKALEEVQEQRQQNKGPASYVRSEQRLLNGSGILRRFGRNTRFGFIEEVDTASAKVNAEVLKLTAEALGSIAKVFGGSLQLEGYLAWMQSLGAMPSELELVTTGEGETTPMAEVENPDEEPLPVGDTEVESGDKTPSQLAEKSYAIDYDEVVIDCNGRIIERRSKVYSVLKALVFDAMQNPPSVQTEDEMFDEALREARSATLDRFNELLDTKRHQYDTWSTTQAIYHQEDLRDLLKRIAEGSELTADHYAMMDFIFDCIGDAEYAPGS